MKTLLFAFISCILIIGACRKENTYHTIVSGKVINFGSKAPIEGVMVVLQDGVALSTNTSSDKKSTVYTDKNGNFSIELGGEHSPYLYPKKDKYSYQYIQGGAVIGLKPFSGGVFQNEVLEMKAEAYFEPWFKSKNDSYLTDTLRIEILAGARGINKYSITGFDFDYYSKGPFEAEYDYLSIGDTYQPFRITLKRQGVTTERIDSVFIKSFETYRDTIYY